MITVRHAAERGHTRTDWLDSYHSFSFGEYYDPRYMGVSILRVINDDTVMPDRGFGTHGHRDMEIVSYVLSGTLAHRDSMGNESLIRPGDVQRMSAGTGIQHSEYNPSAEEPVHYRQGVAPGYARKHFPAQERRGRLRLLVSPDGRDGSICAHQDGLLYGTLLEAEESVEHELSPGRRGYVHVARGSVVVNGQGLRTGDGARIENEATIAIEGIESAEVLLFDLP